MLHKLLTFLLPTFIFDEVIHKNTQYSIKKKLENKGNNLINFSFDKVDFLT